MNNRYNGHESWEHWNVALWLYNDEGLYALVRRAVNRTDNAEDGAVMLWNLLVDANDGGGEIATPDGALYDEENLAAAIAEEYEQ